MFPRRLSENVHLLCCTHPSSLQRTAHVRLIPQDFVRLASKRFSTASIQVVFRQVPLRLIYLTTRARGNGSTERYNK